MRFSFWLLFCIMAINELLADTNIGQRFILVPPCTEDRKELATWYRELQPGGIILFAGHCKNRVAVAALTSFFQEQAKEQGLQPPFITIDWEGGIVERVNEEGGFFTIPSPWLLAKASPSITFDAALLAARQMFEVGINVDFAPCLDMFGSCVLATRCFAAHAPEIERYGIAFCRGLSQGAVAPVIKHFPGLGLGAADTHLESVQIHLNDELLQEQMAPFLGVLKETFAMVMVTHATFAPFGPIPLTRCKKIVELVRKKNPDALLITDDFSMKAASADTSRLVALQEALDAGYHLIISSIPWKEQKQLMDELNCQGDSLKTHQRCLKEIERCKNTLKAQTSLLPVDEKACAAYIAQECVEGCGCVSAANKTSCLVTVDLRKIRPEPWFIKESGSYLAGKLKENGATITQECICNPMDESSLKQIHDFVARTTDETIIVTTFFYADASWNRIQAQWLKSLEDIQERVVVVSLGHPMEDKLLPKARVLYLGSHNQPLLNRAAELLAAPLQLCGLDLLMREKEKYLQNKRFAVLCHRCSTDMNGDFILDLLASDQLVAAFSPEHGLNGSHGAAVSVDSTNNSAWNCPIYSLHGKVRKPTKEMLQGVDLVIVDLQEIGARCFTYLSTLKLTMEACAEHGVEMLVLERPNILGFWKAQGPHLEEDCHSFVGKLPTPFLHGSTIGKLAQQFAPTNLKLTVISCQADPLIYFKARPFIPPSPNLASLRQIYAYPITAFLEGTNYSEGRGTDHPFLFFGAPWVDAEALASRLNQINGSVYFTPISFIPHSIAGVAEHPKHENCICYGVEIHILDPKGIQPVDIGYAILETLFRMYPDESACVLWGKEWALDLLAGDKSWRRALISK